MARSRGFSILFLLPLVLGCFLSASRAEPLPHEYGETGMNEFENLKSVSEVPNTQSGYRGLKEPVDFISKFSRRDSGMREEGEQIGFRRSLINEIRDVLDAFDKAYLDSDKCEKLKDKVSKMVGFVRIALDFVN